MRKGLVALALVIAPLSVPATVSADTISFVSKLVAFGDSLSDPAYGNAYTLTSGNYPPPPYSGNWSNGPTAVQYLAANLGVPLTASTQGGTNYAVGGAATGEVQIAGAPPGTTTNNFNTVSPAVPAQLQPLFADTGVDDQVAQFLGSGSAFDAASTLFFLWAGPNDLFINPSAATAANAVQNLANEIAALYTGGARNFLVPNLPDLSLTPYGLAQDPATQLGLQQISTGFAAGLEQALQALEASLGDINLIRFDTLTLSQLINADPAAFGFANATAPCVTSTGAGFVVCSNPSQYVYWDTVHPTTAAHRQLGTYFSQAVTGQQVPEPATALLLGIATAAALRARRRHW